MAEVDLPGGAIAHEMEARAAWEVAVGGDEAEARLPNRMKLLNIGWPKDANGCCTYGARHVQGAGIIANEEGAGFNEGSGLLEGGLSGRI